jgi:hypothetical protein
MLLHITDGLRESKVSLNHCYKMPCSRKSLASLTPALRSVMLKTLSQKMLSKKQTSVCQPSISVADRTSVPEQRSWLLAGKLHVVGCA